MLQANKQPGQKFVQAAVLRSFYLDGEPQPVGATVKIEERLSIELASAGKIAAPGSPEVVAAVAEAKARAARRAARIEAEKAGLDGRGRTRVPAPPPRDQST